MRRLIARFGPQKLDSIALCVILAIGAFLRLTEIEFAPFMSDDITLWNLARAELAHPQILTRGMESSFGLNNGPFQVYLLLPGIAATPDPSGAYVTVALLNVVGIALFWAFVRRYWDGKLALLAALLYATNPWAVAFSRRLWGNSMVPPFTVLVIWSFCDLVRFGRRRDMVMPFLWLGIAVQLYVVALAHLVLGAFGLVLGVRRLRLPFVLLGPILFAVLIAPYFLWQVTPGVAKVIMLLGLADQKTGVDTKGIYLLFHLVSSEGYQAFANQAGGIYDATTGLPYVVTLVTKLLFVLGLAVGVWEIVRHCRQNAIGQAVPYILPLLALLLPPLLLLQHVSPTGIYPFHAFTGFPMHFLFVALGLLWTERALSTVVRKWRGPATQLPTRAVISALFVIVGTYLVLAQVFFVAIVGYRPESDYGVPLKYTLEITGAAKRFVDQEGFDRVYLGGAEGHSGISYRALAPDIPFAYSFNSNDELIMPDASLGKALYVLSSPEDRIGRMFEDKLLGAKLASINIPGGGVRYSFFGPHRPEVTSLLDNIRWNPVAVTFDGTVNLDSYVVDSELHPGEPAPLILRWSVSPGAAVHDYYAYVRLIDQTGRVVSGTQLNETPQWRPGEHLVWWRTVPVPIGLEPGVYSYRIGLYSVESPTSYRDAIAVDPGGAVKASGVTFGRSVVKAKQTAAPPHPLSVTLGEQVSLEGYGPVDSVVIPGGTLDIDLYWRALQGIDRDYTVFMHFLDASGKIVAQDDSQPAKGKYPTGVWQAGDTIVDRHGLRIPPELAAGQYNLRIGLYDLATGKRLGGPNAAAILPVTVGTSEQ